MHFPTVMSMGDYSIVLGGKNVLTFAVTLKVLDPLVFLFEKYNRHPKTLITPLHTFSGLEIQYI